MRCSRSIVTCSRRQPAGGHELADGRAAPLVSRLAAAARASGRSRLLMATCIGIALSTACDERSPTSPGPPRLSVEGAWAGTVIDRSAGPGLLAVTLIGAGDVGTGTFTLTFADASANVQGAVLARTVNAPRIDLTLNVTTTARDCPGAPGLFYTASAVLDGNRMTGTYEPSIGCPLLRGGSLELTRR